MPDNQINPQRFSPNERQKEIVERTDSPRTRKSLARDLTALGLRTGDSVIVHSSLSSIGWVNGGAVAVIQALQDFVGLTGTIVMPTQSSDLSDPADWRHPEIPSEWIDEVKRTMPAYDPQMTPTRRMGVVPELFRTFSGVVRSSHPSGSFAAWGVKANEIIANHGVQRIGEESPAARLYDLNGKVLLIGVGFERNTCFHLAEYRADSTGLVNELLPLVKDGKVEWCEIEEIEFMDDASLGRLGADFEREKSVTAGMIGSAHSRVFSVRACVDFAVRWLDSRPN